MKRVEDKCMKDLTACWILNRPVTLVKLSVTQYIAAIWIKTLGRQNQPWLLGALTYKGVELERRENWFEPVLNIHTVLSPTVIPVFYFPFCSSEAKTTILRHKKYLGNLPPCPLPSKLRL